MNTEHAFKSRYLALCAWYPELDQDMSPVEMRRKLACSSQGSPALDALDNMLDVWIGEGREDREGREGR